MPTITFSAITVDTDTPDRDGYLVLVDQRLVAVIVRLEAEEHEGLQGSWHLEIGFGRFETAGQTVFASLADVDSWIRARLRRSRPTPGFER